MQPRDPNCGLGSQLARHRRLCTPALSLPDRVTLREHGYQPSIQVVSCSVALAMCFSTVLVLNPCRLAIAW